MTMSTELSSGIRGLAYGNVIIGVSVMILQLVVDITLVFTVADWISSGFWGGVCAIAAGFLTLGRRGNIAPAAWIAALSGIAMALIYIWNAIVVSMDPYYYCSSYIFPLGSCDWRYVADAFFILFGVVLTVINISLVSKAKTITPIIVAANRTRHQVVMQSYPVTTSGGNVTVLGTATNGQVLYQIPVNNGAHATSPVILYPNQQGNYHNGQVVYQAAAHHQVTEVDTPPAYEQSANSNPPKVALP